MLTPEITTTLSDPAWDAFAAGHPYGHFLQSTAWGRVRAGQGWEVRRCLVHDADRPGPHVSPPILAGAQVLIQRRRGGAVAYIPRGPVCAPDDPAWPVLRDALREAAHGCVALRIEPHWPDSPELRQWLIGQGFRAAAPVQPPSTVRLDLSVGEDALLAGMKQTWRRKVRVAAREGVRVDVGGEADLPVFERLVHQTAERQGFGARPDGYYAAVWRAFGPERAWLYLARWGDEALAAILVIHFGATATYLYGGSSGEERQRMPNHLLQWEAIRRATAEGCRCYDFWGIPDVIGQAVVAGAQPEDVPLGSGDLWGVWGFKRGFGGEVWRAVGAWDEVRAPLRYWLGTTALPRLRAVLRGGAAPERDDAVTGQGGPSTERDGPERPDHA